MAAPGAAEHNPLAPKSENGKVLVAIKLSESRDDI
jgi:hypothetical protein